MKIYTAHYYHQRLQNETQEDFPAVSDILAVEEARSRWADLRLIECQGEVIWQHRQSLYIPWAPEQAETLQDLEERLHSFSAQVAKARREGMELEGPMRNGFLPLKA